MAPESNRKYHTVGMAPESNRKYHTVGMAPESNRKYHTVGMAPESNRKYHTVGIAPESNRTYHTVGMAPESNRKYHTIGMAPESDANDIPFQNVHRLGARPDGKERSIIARFTRYNDYERIRKTASENSCTNQHLFVYQHYPREIRF